jgi:hypothetical protein
MNFSLYRNTVKLKVIKLLKPFLVIFLPGDLITGWKSRDRISAINYLENVAKPSSSLIGSYVDIKSFKSILEVGSNSGPNLIGYAQIYPEIKFAGLDLNKDAVKLGNENAQRSRLPNLRFIQVDLTDSKFSKSFPEKADLVFSFATLMYIHPFYIKRVLRDLLEISNQYLVLIEQHHEGFLTKCFPFGIPSGFEASFKRDYKKLVIGELAKLGRSFDSIDIFEVDPRIWAPGGESARIIRVKLNPKP